MKIKVENETVKFPGGLMQVMDFVKSTPSNTGKEGKEKDGSRRRASSWHRNMGWTEMERTILEKGGYWQEGAELLMEAKAETDAELAKYEADSFKRAYAGSRPHVPAFLAGAQKSMIAPQKREEFRPVLRVCVDMGMSAAVDQNEMVNRGAAILTALRAVENKGIEVEIDAVFQVGNSGPTRTYSIRVKSANDKVSIGDFSFALVHPCMTRRVQFALIERDPVERIYRLAKGGSYGHPQRTRPDGYDVFIPSPSHAGGGAFSTPSKAFLKVMDIFETGIEEQEPAA